jgi:dethiobiotin synthetase
MLDKGLFITGIGTDVGKTVASAVMLKALEADYWKPIQCGDLDNTDTHKVSSWTGCKTHSERYRLKEPMSPHAAADIDRVELELSSIILPDSENSIVVEGAGGMMVPLNSSSSCLDIMVQLELPVILVTRHYLGSINHTMLSWNVLKQSGLKVGAVVISGTPHETTETYFRTQMDVPFIRINELEEVNSESIAIEAERLKSSIKSLIK